MADRGPHDDLHKVQAMAYAVPGIATIGYMLYKTLGASYSSTPTTIWLSQTALGVTVLVLIVRWIGATMNELGQIEKYMGYARIIKGEVYIVGLLLALILTALGIFYSDIYVFSLIFSGLCFFNMWGQHLTNSHIKKEWEAGTIARTQASQALEEYYFRRPQFPRFATMLTASLLVGHFAIAGRITGSENYILFAYVIMIANIVGSEVWIFLWRRQRDKEIDDYEYKSANKNA